MKFAELVEKLAHDPKIKSAIDKLLADKHKDFESAYLPRIDGISEFIETEFVHDSRARKTRN